ncbi:hypothetical protein Xhom_03623 [Xenorhabdus hominickii]|uniref:Uncharacterized protein n=1 Tax=Xenorhabdus hominickii TaxID=351679 RepID=A0A2G0Q317_XENHO|nr:hypothetical protein Xhom_03623 [Xenorhabdus hominickii]
MVFIFIKQIASHALKLGLLPEGHCGGTYFYRQYLFSE